MCETVHTQGSNDKYHNSWANEFIEKFIANPQKCDYVIWLVTLRERKNTLLIKTKQTKKLPF